MKVCLSVEIGCGKSECEDTAVFNKTIIQNQTACVDGNDLLCAGVADGVGGNAGGRMASRYIAQQLCQTDFSRMGEGEIRRFVENVNAALIHHAAAIPEKAEMATTLTCVVAANGGYYLIHAGNTRLYVMQGSYLKQLTTDHTTYRWLMDCGQYEAAAQWDKNEINCCLGGGSNRYANRLVVEKLFDAGLPDTLVFTSDGIHGYVDLDDMEDILTASRSDSNAVKRIAEKALQNGSTDDKTIVVVRR